MFDYFYGAQAEQFAFYRVPKVLFTNDRFKYLSAEAKTLYGILLDRVPLSAKNGWIDEQGRVYIICTIEEIMEDMNCGNKKAIQLLSDLEDKVGLIERKRQGLGKPNLIYVKNFIAVDSPVERHFLKCQNDTSGSVEITSLEVSKGHGNKTDIINTEYSDTDSFYSGRSVGKGSEAMRIRAQYEDYFRESLELDYLSRDKGKTIAQSLGDRTDYAKNPEKTDKGELVTGYQCDPMTVDEEFMLSKRQYEQITGRRQKHEVIAYQIRQSFKPGEITPEEANRLGQELALRFTKGKYAFIVATHTDRAHVHNHIVFNSTSIDGTRKFKNFWLSSIALQRVSDLVCLENGLSVIAPKPYKDRAKRTDYPCRVKNRDVLCEDIDTVLQKKPESFEAFLQELRALDYEIKCGKHISVKGKNQARFIRLSSLEDGYTEADLRAHFLGQQERKPREKRNRHTDVRPFNLVIDIQSKLQNKGAGYQRWASVYNLKQMSKTLLFLRDHKAI